MTRVLCVPPLVFLGKISYSLYLWHLPVVVAAGVHHQVGFRAALALAVSVTLATASRYFVELPFLARRRDAATTSVDTPVAPAAAAA